MCDNKEKAIQMLDQLAVNYEIDNHPPAHTIEDLKKLSISKKGEIPKNLFLRDDKGRKHFLVILRHNKNADLVTLRNELGTSRLGFASAERLKKYLNIEPGAVSALNIFNDITKTVKVIFDRSLLDCDIIGIHPNDNSATVWVSPGKLLEIIEENGHQVQLIDI